MRSDSENKTISISQINIIKKKKEKLKKFSLLTHVTTWH